MNRGSSVLHLGYILIQLVYLPRSATCPAVYRPGPAFRQRCILAPELIQIGYNQRARLIGGR